MFFLDFLTTKKSQVHRLFLNNDHSRRWKNFEKTICEGLETRAIEIAVFLVFATLYFTQRRDHRRR